MKLQLRDPAKAAVRGNPKGVPFFTKTGGYQLYERGIAEIGRHGEFVPFADHRVDVRVETIGELSSRVTATRLLAVGVFALALRKKKDSRAAFLTVSVDGEPRWIGEVAGDKAGKAFAFAARVAAAQREVMPVA